VQKHSGLKPAIHGLAMMIMATIVVNGTASLLLVQSKLEVDESVKVLFLRAWRDGPRHFFCAEPFH
jgi:hypothetical protein